MLLNFGAGENSWVPWTARRFNQSILKEISPEYSLEGLMLKLKLQYFWPPDEKNWFIRKDPDAGKDWGQEEKGLTEDEMVGWHHWFNGHEFEQAPGVGDEQGSLACCSPWGHKESDTTEWLNWLNWMGEEDRYPDINHANMLRLSSQNSFCLNLGKTFWKTWGICF